MFCLVQYITNHSVFLLKQVFLLIVFYCTAALPIMISSFVLYYGKAITEIHCVLITCQISCTGILLFPLFSSSAPCTPLEGFPNLPSLVRNWSCINPVKLQISVGNKPFIHIQEKIPSARTRVAPGTGH